MYHFQEVLAHSVETKAVVVRKYKRSPAFGHRHRIVFAYRDASGHIHRKDEAVVPSKYDHLREGSVVDVVYSAKRPYVWAFKKAVEQSRAIARKEERQRDQSSSDKR
ncbi:MAG: DUF3592 domain-containing protein [Roseiflexus sp.]